MALDLCDRATRARLRPQRRGDEVRIDAAPAPPGGFTAAAVDLAMVNAADRHRELVADFAAERPRLRKPQMMGVGGLPPADQAGLGGDEPQVLLVPDAPRLADRKDAFVDAPAEAAALIEPARAQPGIICYSARGPGADRRGKALIYLALEGSHFRAYSHLRRQRRLAILFTCGFTVAPGASFRRRS
jgi:hypothetical protein